MLFEIVCVSQPADSSERTTLTLQRTHASATYQTAADSHLADLAEPVVQAASREVSNTLTHHSRHRVGAVVARYVLHRERAAETVAANVEELEVVERSELRGL